jgi:hypothetical protein
MAGGTDARSRRPAGWHGLGRDLLRRSRVVARSFLWPVDERVAELRPAVLPEAPPVTVVGSIRGSTGMGEVTRAAIAALRERGHPTSFVDLEPLPTLEPAEVPVEAPLPSGHRANLVFMNAVNVRDTYRRLGRAFFAGRINVGCWSWEMTTFPAQWHGAFAPFDEVWVGSRHTQSVLAAVSPVPVLRIPNLVRPAAPSARTRADFGFPDDRFVFLFCFDACSVVERKNPAAIVRAFRRAFGSSAPGTGPLLVLKMNNGDLAARRPALFGLDPGSIPALAQSLEEVGGILLDERFDRATTSALMYACDAYVSLHRCEGFGLTMAEAMSMGKPCIATGWSGNLDFMTAANSYLVGFRLVALERDYGPYRAGEQWAEPDEEDAARWMRHVHENREEAHRRGRVAASDLAREHGASAAAGAILDRLRLLEERRRRGGRLASAWRAGFAGS